MPSGPSRILWLFQKGVKGEKVWEALDSRALIFTSSLIESEPTLSVVRKQERFQKNLRKIFGNLWKNLGKFLEILGKFIEILGKFEMTFGKNLIYDFEEALVYSISLFGRRMSKKFSFLHFKFAYFIIMAGRCLFFGGGWRARGERRNGSSLCGEEPT